MATKPEPSTNGQIIKFHHDLFCDLIEAKHEITDILGMSLSKALLARYGSKLAVDQELGNGTYQGVRQSHGGLSSWRKGWSEVLKRERLRHAREVGALAVFSSCVEACLRQGITPKMIVDEAEKAFPLFARILQ